VRSSATTARTAVAELLNAQVHLIQTIKIYQIASHLFYFHCLKIDLTNMARGQLSKTTESVSNYIELYRAISQS
jgi:hypothetical protein